jgi:hypothetical protein
MSVWKMIRLLFGVVLALSVGAMAGQKVVYVTPPNGTDDTANIQAALNACVTQGAGCTAQLREGKYFTRQVVTYNFRGTFKGMGMDRTTIEALPKLPVNIPDPAVYGECLPNTTTCLWPSLIIFVDGDIHVSDLSIHITAPPGAATTGWTVWGLYLTTLLDGLRFMGQHPTNVSIDRISIEGLPDDSPDSFGILVGFPAGFNVVNGVIYTGELPRSSAPFDYYFLSGSLTVRNSFFKGLIDGVSQDGFFQSSHVTIGGSPTTGNRFENVIVGMDMESSQSSVYDISYNVSSGITDGMWVEPWQPAFVPSSPSHYFIHDNTFSTTGAGTASGPSVQAIYLYNDPSNPWIRATIWNNRLAPQAELSDGIDAFYTKGTVIWNNIISGSGYDAVGLRGSTQSAVIGNDVNGFTPDPAVGLAQIYLDPNTTEDLVVCAQPSNTVLNQGTNNTVIDCKKLRAGPESVTNNVDPAAYTPGPHKSRPWHY